MKEMKDGDLVYFKEARLEPANASKRVKFDTQYAYGILLGVTEPFKTDEPTPVELFRKMAHHGFIKFDDIAIILGEEAVKKCVEGFKDLYYGKKVESVPPLLDEHGRTIDV